VRFYLRKLRVAVQNLFTEVKGITGRKGGIALQLWMADTDGSPEFLWYPINYTALSLPSIHFFEDCRSQGEATSNAIEAVTAKLEGDSYDEGGCMDYWTAPSYLARTNPKTLVDFAGSKFCLFADDPHLVLSLVTCCKL
jgi:hypothetical protein